ncbi:MAG: hypothetical protein ACTHOJ_12905, partial [Sphingomonas oligoaromativorans]
LPGGTVASLRRIEAHIPLGFAVAAHYMRSRNGGHSASEHRVRTLRPHAETDGLPLRMAGQRRGMEHVIFHMLEAGAQIMDGACESSGRAGRMPDATGGSGD